MGGIIQFPIKEVCDVIQVERTIREYLKDTSLSQEIVDIICERMKKRWNNYSKKGNYSIAIKLPGTLSKEDADAINDSIRQQISIIEKQFQKFTSEALFEILNLDVELTLLKNQKNI